MSPPLTGETPGVQPAFVGEPPSAEAQLLERLSAGKRFDVFVSYAHADDVPPLNEEIGWVSTLVVELKKLLRQKLGGHGADVWMDYRLAGNERVSETLYATVKASRVLLLVMSPGYRKSHWCGNELGTFLADNVAHKNKESVFIVEVEPTKREEWHERLQSLTPIQFWSKTETEIAPRRLGLPLPSLHADPAYWRRLNELAYLIAGHVESLRTESPSNAVPPSTGAAEPVEPARTFPTVWVAEPADGREAEWDAIVGALRQDGCEVLPPAPRYYARASQGQYVGALQADLARSSLCVQLLGPPNWSGADPFALIQAECANHAARAAPAERPFMQWRPVGVQLDQIADARYAELLRSARESSIETFRQDVLAAVRRIRAAEILAKTTPAPPAGAPGHPTLCVQADRRDKALGEDVCNIIEQLGGHPTLIEEPDSSQSPEEYRRHVESILLDAQGVMIVFGRAPTNWLQARLSHVRKWLVEKRLDMPGAVMDAPPPENPIPPREATARGKWRVLDCRQGVAHEQIAAFLRELAGAADA